jgi:DNA polymerase III alpha subunit
MNNRIGLWKSHFSIGKSILTLEKPREGKPHLSDSIFDILLEKQQNSFFLIEDSFSGFLQAYKNSSENKIKLIYGLRLNTCINAGEKNETSLEKRHKIIIIAKNTSGINLLMRIFSAAAKEGFYYEPCLDSSILKRYWSDDDLQLAIPFYDSFIHNNFLKGKTCVPSFDFCKSFVFFQEDNNLPFDSLISERLADFSSGKYEIINSKTIYYKAKKDFLAYMTFRCINNRSTLEKPNLEHMSSNEFCAESLFH